jgi:hypothetical protein
LLFEKAIMNNSLFRASCLNARDQNEFCMSLDEKSSAAASQLIGWATKQFVRVGAELSRLAGHQEGGVAIPAIQGLSELMTLMHGSAGTKPIALQTEWIKKVSGFVLICNDWLMQTSNVTINWDMFDF